PGRPPGRRLRARDRGRPPGPVEAVRRAAGSRLPPRPDRHPRGIDRRRDRGPQPFDRRGPEGHMKDLPRIALITYSTRPRGGPVHTVELAEALHDLGCPVHVFAIGDPAAGFYRPLGAPHTIFPGPEPGGTLEERVF